MDQRPNKYFSNDISINLISVILKEEETDLKVDEIVIDKEFEKSNTEIEMYESIEELKYPQEHDSNHSFAIVLDDLSETGKNNPQVQAMYKKSRHNNISIFFQQEYYELPKRTIPANCNIYHIFK